MPRTNQAYRSWCFTWNNPPSESIEELRNRDWANEHNLKYIVFQEEIGANQTHHLQGFVQFTTTKGLQQVKTCITRGAGSCHLVNSIAPAQAAEYCQKQDTRKPGTVPFHWGVAPVSQKRKGEAEKERWDKIKRQCQEGKLDEIESKVYVTQYKTLKVIAADHQKKPRRLKEAECRFELWIGPTGSGKTSSFWKEFPDGYDKGHNKWWCNYKQGQAVLIDELSPSFDKGLVQLLKKWTDRSPFSCEAKGGFKMIRPKVVIITSNYELDELFGYDQKGLLEPMNRRLKIRHFEVNDDYQSSDEEDDEIEITQPSTDQQMEEVLPLLTQEFPRAITPDLIDLSD